MELVIPVVIGLVLGWGISQVIYNRLYGWRHGMHELYEAIALESLWQRGCKFKYQSRRDFVEAFERRDLSAFMGDTHGAAH